MALTQSRSPTEEITTYGFLRDVLDKDQDCVDIIKIIIEYCKQGFAVYFDSELDADYKKKMNFGDIVRNGDDFDAMNMTNQLIHAGEDSGVIYDDSIGEDLDIKIPFEICEHLTDAIYFYSKLVEHEYFKKAKDFSFALDLKKDDKWIIDNLKGALNHQYSEISVIFRNYKFYKFIVQFGPNCRRDFDAMSPGITHKDVDKFYEIRTDKDNLVKIRVKWNTGDDGVQNRVVLYRPFPALWNCRTVYAGDEDEIICVDHIGPKTDIDTINKIQEHFNSMQDEINVVIVDVGDEDTVF